MAEYISLYEKETIINFNDGEKSASYFTLNDAKKRMLLKLKEERPNEVTIKEMPGGGLEAVFPKDWVKVRPPRIMTDEQREKAVERGKKLAEMRKNKEV